MACAKALAESRQVVRQGSQDLDLSRPRRLERAASRSSQHRHLGVGFVARTDSRPTVRNDPAEEDFEWVDERGEERQGVHDVSP
jgi:hypothetical protein